MPDEIRLVAYTDAETFGGAEQCLATILAGLPPAFSVTVAATDAGVAESVAATRPSAEIALVDATQKFWSASAVASHRRLFRRLASHLCLLNLRTPYACLHATTAALLSPRTKLVAIEHLPLSSQSRAARGLKRIAARRLAAHVAVSEHTARSVEASASLPARSIQVVHNGVPEPSDGSLDFHLPRPIIGAVGRLEQQKGLDLFLDALALLPGVSAVVAGDGPEREALLECARAKGLADRFALTGWLHEVGPFLRSLDVFVLPSRFEGLSLALLEAMAVGTAVVASNVGGAGEAVVSEETGVLVPPDSPIALAEAIGRVLNDPIQREKLGAAAREAWLANFTAQRMQQAYTDLLIGLLQ